MPISPNVQAYMQQGQQPQEAATADHIFAKSFSDQAFTALKSKFPALVGSVVTFKTLSSDVEHGDAVGAFILVSGDKVRYVPVTMSNGNVGSNCEMIYDKEADLFEPLTEESIKHFLSATTVSDPQVLRHKTRVEDTKPIFRNMVRPPQSSNVILAASRDGLSALPNHAKQAVADHFMENPELLAKIAEFYPVEHLANKLAKVAEQPAVAQDIPEVIKISDLTKEAAEKLSEEHRKQVLERGYAIIDGKEAIASIVLSSDDKNAISDSLKVTEWPVDVKDLSAIGCNYCCSDEAHSDSYDLVRGKIVVFSGTGFLRKDALLGGKTIYMEGYRPTVRTCLVSDMKHEVSTDDVKKHTGALSIDDFAEKVMSDPSRYSGGRVVVFTPTRNGGWRSSGAFNLHWDHSYPLVTHVDNVWHTGVDRESVVITPAITHGKIKSGNTVIYPENSLFLLQNIREEAEYVNSVPSVDTLIEVVQATGRPLKVTRDGVDIRITDKRAEKTACFNSDADASAYLQSEYGLKSDQIDSVLASRDSILYKNAFDYGSLGMGYQEAPATHGLPAMPEAPAFDPTHLADYAEFEDPELMDTGILAAFADDPDVRSLLVDYIQDFMEQQDKLARIILIFTMNKRKLEESYGIDKLANILSSCRKIFKFIGELVANIRQYINMAAS